MNNGTYEGILNQDDAQEHLGDDARPFYPERAEITVFRARTHYDGCYRAHLECALVKIKELEAEHDAANKRVEQAEAAIKNTCPSCGRQSLFVARGGWITCARKSCKQPSMRLSIMALKAERDSAINRLKEREAEYDLQIRAATIGVELVTKMLETYQAEYVKMVECFRAANAAKRTMRAFLFSASERAEQAEADARAFAELLDGGKWSPPFRARWTKYLEAK